MLADVCPDGQRKPHLRSKGLKSKSVALLESLVTLPLQRS